MFQTNCKNCGAPLRNYRCEYCGTEYREDPITKTVVIKSQPVGVIPLGAEVRIKMRHMEMIPEEEREKLILEELTNSISKKVAKYISLQKETDIRNLEYRYRGTIRVLDDSFRF